MEFETTEIKMLGYGLGRSLSLRLDATNESKSASSGFTKAAHTIHAVVPFSPEFGNVQVGQKFKFERIEEPLHELTESERRQFLKENGVNVKKGERV
jgi:plastocyanin